MSRSISRVVSQLMKGVDVEKAREFKSLHVAAILDHRRRIICSAINSEESHAEVSAVRALLNQQWEKPHSWEKPVYWERSHSWEKANLGTFSWQIFLDCNSHSENRGTRNVAPVR